MSKYFLTKTWGFDPEHYPALGFSEQGRLRNYLKASTPEDWVLIVGTLGDNTAEHQRGRLLGKCRLGRTEIDVDQTLRAIGTEIPEKDRRPDGTYKWPNGLPMVEAHRFDGTPDIKELFGDYLPNFVWAVEAREIEEHIKEGISKVIDALPTTEVKICDAPEILKHRAKNASLTGMTGPVPCAQRSASHSELAHGFGYAMKLCGTPRTAKPVYKVGYSSNPERRLKELNGGLLSVVTGFKWVEFSVQPFESWKEAFAFEQLLHERLASKRIAGETEIYRIDEKAIQSEWNTVFAEAGWAMAEIQNRFLKSIIEEEIRAR